MSTLELPSAAERYADKAAQYSAFSGLSLAKVRREMSELLGLIRANGIFEEYTKHDISHIDRMLSQLDWLIPAETQSIMTAADWLLIVLATYFHDLGMVVTRDEYSQRYSTPFSAFRDKVMGSKETIIKDYAARVEDLPPDEAERFLYQEYVRDNHSRRIRAWIDIQENPQVGITKAMAEEVKRILGPLEPVFREDLAIICESHHLDDLENTAKYPVSRPYGPNAQEAANVQYAAVLLRTIDLLDITSDRAPSISFRIINPRDLVSQREWAKHSAVRSVRPKIAEDDEGNLDPALPQDTIEVHARYENAEGFFGLTSYLLYAEGQIRLSHDWVSTANRRMGSQYQFPWRSIDSSNIETKGFLDRPFEFTLDQDKILELLTGHTLYNDTGVVLRELLQNSIDAVRLAHGDDAESNGSIQVRWNSDKRILEVRDNGTGMTQDIIERHFLRVGASYYQDSQFQKRNPGFNAISRFGIGVLSTFMVADHVEVVTCHLDEPDARKLELRTVHGKYLIRLLDKNQDEEAAEIGPSGTMVRLHVRPSAVINDIVQLGRKWIVVPRCPVTIAVDGRKPETIGHKSVKAALEQALAYSDWVDSGDDMLKIRIVERQKDGVSLAYALRWSDYFKEWNFIQLFDEPEDDREPRYILGTCVEGVRVEADPPGFTQASRANIAAIANVVGPGAPRTNVARSSFEQTDEYRQCLRQIYLLYAAHITEELGEIQTQRRQSLTWAASEGQYLAMALMRSGEATSNEELMSAFETIPMFLLEQDGQRLGVSANGLTEGNSFWTVEGALHEHIEYLLREIPESISLTSLLKSFGSTVAEIPTGPVLCTRLDGGICEILIRRRWDVVEITADEERRRSAVRWVKAGSGPIWGSARGRRWAAVVSQLGEMKRRFHGYRHTAGYSAIPVPIRGVDVSGFRPEHSAVMIGRRKHLLPGTRWPSVLKVQGNSEDLAFTNRYRSDPAVEALSVMLMTNEMPLKLVERELLRTLRESEVASFVDIDAFIELRRELGWSVYDTRRWQRQDGFYEYL